MRTDVRFQIPCIKSNKEHRLSQSEEVESRASMESDVSLPELVHCRPGERLCLIKEGVGSNEGRLLMFDSWIPCTWTKV